MDKIERIHIAKTPYHIESKAELQLKKYLADIRAVLDIDTADEVIHDIESRIPELLLTRHVKANGVVTEADVAAVKEHLGQPEQFSEEEASPKAGPAPKKLFRDMDAAIIGGVASGIGQYVNIDANLIRIAFFILIFFGGFGVILYLFLWLLLPEAKTGADKLMMMGKPVTAAALQRYRVSVQHSLGKGPKLVQQLLIKLIRLLSVLGTSFLSLCLLVVFAVFSSLFYIYPFRPILNSYDVDYVVLALMWLGCLAFIGLLVSLTLRIYGHRSSQLNYSALSLATLFIVSTAGTSMAAVLAYNHFSAKYTSNKIMHELSITNRTPKTAPGELNINSDSNLDLTYVVTNAPMHATYEAFPGMNQPNLTIMNQNGILQVASSQLAQAAPNCLGDLCKKIYLPVRVYLYGPALKQYFDINGASLTINNANLGDTVSFTARNSSTINLNNSYATNMEFSASNNSTISANNTTTQNTTLSIDATSNVTLPITNTLNATLPMSCTQSDYPNTLLFLSGNPLHTLINGQSQTNNSLVLNNCISNND